MHNFFILVTYECQWVIIISALHSTIYWSRVSGTRSHLDVIELFLFSNWPSRKMLLIFYNPGTDSLLTLKRNKKKERNPRPHASSCQQTWADEPLTELLIGLNEQNLRQYRFKRNGAVSFWYWAANCCRLHISSVLTLCAFWLIDQPNVSVAPLSPESFQQDTAEQLSSRLDLQRVNTHLFNWPPAVSLLWLGLRHLWSSTSVFPWDTLLWGFLLVFLTISGSSTLSPAGQKWWRHSLLGEGPYWRPSLTCCLNGTKSPSPRPAGSSWTLLGPQASRMPKGELFASST